MIQMGKRGVREAAIGATAAQKLAHRNTHLRMIGIVLIQCKRAQCFEQQQPLLFNQVGRRWGRGREGGEESERKRV